MKTLPSDAELTDALVVALGGRGGPRPELLARRPGPRSSTFPSEILTCRATGRETLELFCKYGGGISHTSLGHRGDVAYEASVYRSLLDGLPLRIPAFYGAYSSDRSGDVWLFLEHVAGAQVVDSARNPDDALVRAASWIGRFHAIFEGVKPTEILRTYESPYYAQWARRSESLAGSWHRRLPWLTELCRRAEEFAPDLAAMPRTVVHGEYTPHNLLVCDGEVCPIDWESAAVALGEIDLVCLVDKWPPDLALSCTEAYVDGRWPGGAPEDFDRRLDMARLYWDLRWLGDRPEWTASAKVGLRFESLRGTGERLGLL
jgi:hypothetical protein